MKNIKTIFVALSAAALLAGCGAKAKWDTISYERVLTNAEKAVLVAKVESATFEKISKYELNTTQETKNALRDSHSENKAVAEFFANGEAYKETTIKGKTKVDGKVVTRTSVRKEALAQYDPNKYAQFFINEEDEWSYNQYEIPEGYDSYAARSELEDLMYRIRATGIAGQFQAVEDKKGNQFFLYSAEEETYTPDPTYTAEQKVEHEIHREQGVAYLNKDFSLKSFTYYEIRQTNRDPETGKYSNKAKTVSERKEVYSFTYGSRQDGSSKLGSYRDQAKNGYCLTGAYALSAKLLKEDGTALTNLALNKTRDVGLSYSKRHLVYKADHVQASVGDVAVDTIKLTFNGSAKCNSVTDPVNITDVEMNVNSLSEGHSGMSLVNGKLKMGKGAATLTLEFDVEASSAGVTFSNVNAYAEMYYED